MIFKSKITRETTDIRTIQPIITNSIILLNAHTRAFVQTVVSHTCSNDSTHLTDNHVIKHNFSKTKNKYGEQSKLLVGCPGLHCVLHQKNKNGVKNRGEILAEKMVKVL